jgi:transcriptional regulator
MGPSRDDERTALLKGTLALLILRTLALQPLHGLAIADRIQQASGGAFRVPAGSLFPALHKLEEGSWIRGEWTVTGDGRRIKTYSLTGPGRRKLSAERRTWARTVAAMSQVLEPR